MNYNSGKNSRTENQLTSIAIYCKIFKDGLQPVEAFGGYENKSWKETNKSTHVSEAWLESRIIDLQIKDGWLAMRLIPEAWSVSMI